MDVCKSGKEISSTEETLRRWKLHLCFYSGLQLTLLFLPTFKTKLQESEISSLSAEGINHKSKEHFSPLTAEEAGCLTFLQPSLSEIKHSFSPYTLKNILKLYLKKNSKDVLSLPYVVDKLVQSRYHKSRAK